MMSYSWIEIICALDDLHPTIEQILSISGSAGASIGVMHQGVVLWEAHFGHRDHARTRQPDSDTLYGIGSLSKSMVAQVVGNLVDQNVMSWDEPISNIIPEFKNRDSKLTGDCNIKDLLSHRSGLPAFDALWYQGGSLSLVPKSALIPIVSAMTPCFQLRSGWQYSNWGYALAGEVIERKTNIPFHHHLKKSLFEPLGMHRTTLDPEWRKDDNCAEGFMGMNDATFFPIHSQVVDHTDIMGAATGICSSIKDLLIYYKALLRPLRYKMTGLRFPVHTVFKELGTIFGGQVAIPGNLREMDEYTLGWVKSRLPCQLSYLSDNRRLLTMSQTPIIGVGTMPQVIFYHNSSLAGFTSTVMLLPELQICVLVLVNTKASCDSASSIAKAVLEVVLDAPQRHDFVALTEATMENSRTMCTSQESELDKARLPDSMSKHLVAYAGRYHWDSEEFFVDIFVGEDIFVHDEQLKLKFMDRPDEVYELIHHHFDTFTWLMTDDEEKMRARSRYLQSTGAYTFVFFSNEVGEIVGFVWQDMGGGPGTFKKVS